MCLIYIKKKIFSTKILVHIFSNKCTKKRYEMHLNKFSTQVYFKISTMCIKAVNFDKQFLAKKFLAQFN